MTDTRSEVEEIHAIESRRQAALDLPTIADTLRALNAVYLDLNAIALRLAKRVEEATRENDVLRSVVAKAKIPCVYCGLDDMSKCASGFPGCAKADDIMCGEEAEMLAMLAERNSLRESMDAQNEIIQALRERVERLEGALSGVLNHWEPECKAEDCDKGGHVEAITVWQEARAALSPAETKEPERCPTCGSSDPKVRLVLGGFHVGRERLDQPVILRAQSACRDDLFHITPQGPETKEGA